MYCIRCGKENLDSAKFCNECGFDFRTLNGKAQPEQEEIPQPKVALKKEPPVVEQVTEQKEEPKKKKGRFLKRVIFTSLLALAIFFVQSGGMTELMSEINPTPTPEPTPIVVPTPDSRYHLTITGAADDEFCTVMEMLIEERDTMETPVFVCYEWKALKQFKGATFEQEYMKQLAPAYLQVLESQQRLYSFGTKCHIADEDLHDQAQDNKNKLIVFMMLYGELMPGRDDVRAHYETMANAYLNEQLIFEDFRAQLVDVPYQTDTVGNVHYLTYTNNIDMPVDVKFSCTYKYPDSYEGKGGYQFEEWDTVSVEPGETIRLDLTKIDTTKRVEIQMKWDLEGVYLDGEEIYKY